MFGEVSVVVNIDGVVGDIRYGDVDGINIYLVKLRIWEYIFGWCYDRVKVIGFYSSVCLDVEDELDDEFCSIIDVYKIMEFFWWKKEEWKLNDKENYEVDELW